MMRSDDAATPRRPWTLRWPLTVAASVALTAAGVSGASAATPTTRKIANPPVTVALDGESLWTLEQADPPVVRRRNRLTGAALGPAVPIDASVISYPFTARPFFVACCDITPPLTVAAGSVWTVEPALRQVVRITPGPGGLEVVRIPTAGTPRDVTAGPSGVWVLEVRVGPPTNGAPWRSHRFSPVDLATSTLGPPVDFDVPVAPGGNVRFDSNGPLHAVVGGPGVLFGTYASVTVRLGRIDPAAGTVAGTAVGARALARSSASSWAKAIGGCTIVRIRPDGTGVPVPGRWRVRSPTCRLRALAPDRRGDLWAIAGYLRPGQRGRVFRIDGVTGAPEPAVTVGRDPVAIAGARGVAWVADYAGRSLTRVQ